MRGPGHAYSSRPGAVALLAAVGLHALVLFGFWWFGVRVVPAPANFRVYRVNIVSPPAQAFGAPQIAPPVVNPANDGDDAAKTSPKPEPKKPVVEAPKPEKKPVVASPPKPAPKKEPAKKPAAKKPEPEKPAPAEKSSSAAKKKAETTSGKGPAPSKGANPHPDAAGGGSGINVQLQGEAFPFPGYLENIILQISRYFRWNGSPELRADAYFIIDRDGSVSDIRILKSSGNVAFDFTVQGAIEAAGKRKAFGPLPKGFEGDRLPISFYFQPPR